jgi:hypothetical protein
MNTFDRPTNNKKETQGKAKLSKMNTTQFNITQTQQGNPTPRIHTQGNQRTRQAHAATEITGKRNHQKHPRPC